MTRPLTLTRERAMLKLAIAYAVTGVAFLLLDGAWLALAGTRLYRPALDGLLADRVRLVPAALFYLLYVAGLVYFCVRPGLDLGWRKALVSGAILGLVAYGAYDLTCQAVMRTWSWNITLADLAWGAFASASAATLGVVITRAAAPGPTGAGA
jgi:uncharacterized membrane protein